MCTHESISVPTNTIKLWKGYKCSSVSKAAQLLSIMVNNWD